jgi:hypothetical protein
VRCVHAGASLHSPAVYQQRRNAGYDPLPRTRNKVARPLLSARLSRARVVELWSRHAGGDLSCSQRQRHLNSAWRSLAQNGRKSSINILADLAAGRSPKTGWPASIIYARQSSARKRSMTRIGIGAEIPCEKMQHLGEEPVTSLPSAAPKPPGSRNSRCMSIKRSAVLRRTSPTSGRASAR